MSGLPRTIAVVLGCLFSAAICLAAGQDNKPLLTLYGRNSKITEMKVLRVTSEKEWKALWLEHKTGSPDPTVAPGDLEYAELDFGKVMAIAVFEGEASNCAGYTAHSISEDRERITVRLRAHSYGSAFETPVTQAWGILVLPRSDKEIVLERDIRSEKIDPPVWKEWKKFPPLPSTEVP
jgi:hypothetical protein